MQSVIDFADGGGLVMGICNGFQTLVEAGLLPGGLIRNTGPQVRLPLRQPARRDDGHAVHRAPVEKGELLRIVVKHNEGNYTVDPDDAGAHEGRRPDRRCAT